jgi:hypothetical protein
MTLRQRSSIAPGSPSTLVFSFALVDGSEDDAWGWHLLTSEHAIDLIHLMWDTSELSWRHYRTSFASDIETLLRISGSRAHAITSLTGAVNIDNPLWDEWRQAPRRNGCEKYSLTHSAYKPTMVGGPGSRTSSLPL